MRTAIGFGACSMASTSSGVDGPADYESAAELYRVCRRRGETPRRLVDCLIAVVAIRNNVELLCRDVDFEVIARHAPSAAQT